MSSYKGLDLFGSGPHRFALGPRQQLVLTEFALSRTPLARSYPFGPEDWDVLVTGRLVASSEPALRALRDAIPAELEELGQITPGVLTDGLGRTWEEMVLTGYEEADRVDRGRVFSVGYVATFRNFETLFFAQTS